MAQIIPRDSIAERFGSGISSGISKALDEFAQTKMREMAENKRTTQLSRALRDLNPNLSEKQSDALASMGERLILPWIERGGLSSGGEQQGNQQDMSELLSGFSGSQQAPQQQQMQQNPQELLNQFSNGGYQGSPLDVLRNFLGQQQGSSQQQYVPSQASGISPSPESFARSPEKRNSVADVFALPSRREKLEERRHKEKLSAVERKTEQDLKLKTHKETAVRSKEITDQLKRANEEDQVLDRMKDKAEKGTLSSPVYNKGLEKLGLNIGGLQSGDTEEFVKDNASFIKNVRAISGGKITDSFLKSYLKSIPDLSQSDAGKLRIISTMKGINAVAKKRFELMRKLREENSGYLPLDFDEQIEERLAPDIDKIYKSFKGRSSLRGKGGISLSAKEYKGKTARDPETGETLYSNGETWLSK